MLSDCPFWTSRTDGSMLYIPISYFSTSSPDLSQECQEPDPRRTHPAPAHSVGREGGKVVSARQRRARTAARIRRTKISAKRGIKISINTTYSSNNYTTIALHYEHVKVICFASNSSNTITIRISMHCCCSSVSCRAAAGEGWRGRGGKATEDGCGRAGWDNSGVAASLTASVRLALAGSKTRQRLADGYRSAHWASLSAACR